jgi:hypothetical protein
LCVAIFVSLLFPNLNSLARLSLIGSIAAVVYSTILWTFSVSKSRPEGISHDPSKSASTEAARICDIINALGIIAISFRGHNVVLEIQVKLMTVSNPPFPLFLQELHFSSGVLNWT